MQQAGDNRCYSPGSKIRSNKDGRKTNEFLKLTNIPSENKQALVRKIKILSGHLQKGIKTGSSVQKLTANNDSRNIVNVATNNSTLETSLKNMVGLCINVCLLKVSLMNSRASPLVNIFMSSLSLKHLNKDQIDLPADQCLFQIIQKRQKRERWCWDCDVLSKFTEWNRN